ncbi:MAG: hypothetical protein JXB49_35645 [Bacteroidales bacterium]|nr:hypothetical protein [Bacteroidales bacterium]
MSCKKNIILAFFILLTASGFGQFYNGHQMIFGKNRVQYNDFYWTYYRYERFDAYFNQEGMNLAQYTSDIVQKELIDIERFFDYSLEKRLILIVFNKMSDYRQSNIGLVTGKDEYNTGGVTKIINNKVFIYFEGDHEKFRIQIRAAIAEVVINEMLYGNSLTANVANSTLINLPEWYIKGLVSYVASDWSLEIENYVKDGILSKNYEKINRLTGKDAMYAGHSFWKYIAETYGEQIIPNIIYITRINKNSNSGFLYVLGQPIKNLSYDWLGYYINEYTADAEKRKEPDKNNKILKRTKKKRVYQQLKISPGGDYIAFTTNESGQYKIWLYDTRTQKVKKLLKKEHKIDQITDYSYPVLAWHPSGRLLTFITEEEGMLRFYIYTLETKTLQYRTFLYYEKILSYSYSQDGLKLVISGTKWGKTDIYIHHLASGTNEQITNDIADDLDPKFIDNGAKILFSSNRTSDSLDQNNTKIRLAPSHDLYIYDYKTKSKTLTRITDYDYTNQTSPSQISYGLFSTLDDKNGIVNISLLQLDSSISNIDTTIHYRYSTNSYPVTNFTRNIQEMSYDKSSSQIGELMLYKGRQNLYSEPLDLSMIIKNSNKKPLEKTKFRDELTQKMIMKDSMDQVTKQDIPFSKLQDNFLVVNGFEDTLYLDNNFIDINNYVFEKEKINYYNEKFSEYSINITLEDTSLSEYPDPRIYETVFYTNYVVNQVDFSFLNNSYQAFTGGAVYYNPGLNLLFKLGANDLFEDYKIIGGVRFSSDFESNEYLISIENLKDRLDKQVLFHRQVFKSYIEDILTIKLLKTHTHEIMYVLKYPFNQVSSVKGTFSFRQDRTMFLSADQSDLGRDYLYKLWGGLKVEYIFDNTRKLGTNIYEGTRYKIFGEAYKQINERNSELFVVGADFRHYTKIHRNLILANRFAASSSFGTSRLVYYLGSLDNWINLSRKVSTFDNSVPIENKNRYAYQTLATNMRGFTQNIRNGNNFALINNEIRWPFVQYFANYPISSAFWSNLQVVGFFDVGTAWTGLTPYSGENSYDTDIIEDEAHTYKVTLDSNRDPIVAGYGFGARSQLFGYFLRLDWAWGIENQYILPRIFYFSLSLDF